MNETLVKEELLAALKKAAGSEAGVELRQIPQNNDIRREAVTVRLPDQQVSPTIFMEQILEKYEGGMSLEEISRSLIEECRRIARYARPVSLPEDKEEVKSRIFRKLINFEWNRGSLFDLPHRKFMDLAVVYYYETPCPTGQDGFVTIRSRDLCQWGMSFDELDRAAAENERRERRIQVKPLQEVLFGEVMDRVNAPEMAAPIYVMMNISRTFGAAGLLNQTYLRQLSEELHHNLFILPSSIHELILTPDCGYFSRSDLTDMVREINATQVKPEEVLSDHVYEYIRTEGRIMM